MSTTLPTGLETTLSPPPAGADGWTPSRRYEAECRRTASLLMLCDLGAFTGVALVLLASSQLWGFPSDGFAMKSGLLFAAIAPMVFALFNLYGFRALTTSVLDEARAIASALALLTLAWLFFGLLLRPGSFGRPEAIAMAAWLSLAFVLGLAMRGAVRAYARHRNPERVLIYGAGQMGQTLAERIRTSGHGIRVVGFVDDDPIPLRDSLKDIPVLPESQGITPALRETDATRLVLAFSSSPTHQVLESIRTSKFGRLPISIVPRYFEITPAHSTLSEINGVPLLDLRSAQLSHGARAAKRALDLIVAAGALVVLAPVLAAIAVAVKLDSRGPVFFRQERLGSNGRPFHILKFRSMVQDAEAQRMGLADRNEMEGSGPLFKMKNDPRVTRTGRFLRKTSLDELPQLFNVLSGDMSVVGPRPFVTHEAVQIQGWGRKRLDIKPGITGLWQVRGRNDVPFDEMVRLDYMYVTNWSLWWDIRLILQTVPRVLRGDGAS